MSEITFSEVSISEGERFFNELKRVVNSEQKTNLSSIIQGGYKESYHVFGDPSVITVFPRKRTMKVETMLINGVSKDIKIMNRDILTAHQEKEQRIRDYCAKLEFIHNQCEDDRIRKDRADAAAAARNQDQAFQTEDTIEALAKATYNPMEWESMPEEVKIVKKQKTRDALYNQQANKVAQSSKRRPFISPTDTEILKALGMGDSSKESKNIAQDIRDQAHIIRLMHSKIAGDLLEKVNSSNFVEGGSCLIQYGMFMRRIFATPTSRSSINIDLAIHALKTVSWKGNCTHYENEFADVMKYYHSAGGNPHDDSVVSYIAVENIITRSDLSQSQLHDLFGQDFVRKFLHESGTRTGTAGTGTNTSTRAPYDQAYETLYDSSIASSGSSSLMNSNSNSNDTGITTYAADTSVTFHHIEKLWAIMRSESSSTKELDSRRKFANSATGDTTIKQQSKIQNPSSIEAATSIPEEIISAMITKALDENSKKRSQDGASKEPTQ